ncbi:class F sortase [Arthrobacter sp. Leaf137]|uniref:class F sortase n=1 Tax=Arthrobacter sp. Leaf137 TaxID=1736271 RepID=UPI0006F9D672|nr:class F sortase [Arthrobacter sp. Leaf137]KQQ82343.1 peptidase C60 [Arthrobacter sp. Leaf137]
MNGRTTTAGESRRRPSVGVRIAAAASIVVLTACAPAGQSSAPSTAPASTAASAAAAATDAVPAAPGTTVPGAAARPGAVPIPVHPATLGAVPADPAPTSISIAGTAIDMSVVPGGVSGEGAMEIPDAFDRAAWYRFGPAPGAAEGAAVIAGHIDTASDRAPFSALKSLAEGTAVRVGRDGAPDLTYRVVRVELMAKDRFDGGSLFRRTGPHELKVVTCGGRWLDERMDYSDNVIVTAVPG